MVCMLGNFSFGLRYLRAELREDQGSYSDYLATALFFTGCRYHEWTLLTMDRLVRELGLSPPGFRSKAARFAICRSQQNCRIMSVLPQAIRHRRANMALR